MAGHIQDRWYKTEPGPDGKPRRVKTERHGAGSRYRARYIGPDGAEKSMAFPDRQKRQAEQWLANIEADMSRGQYIDPQAARVTFRQFAERWLESQTTDLNTRSSVEAQVRRHAIPYLGIRPMDSFQPSHIREWLSELEKVIPASSYRRVIFGNVSSIFMAAMEDRLRTTNPCRSRAVTPPGRAPGRVRPWTADRVSAVRAGLPARYRAMVDAAGACGLRQGEVFGLPIDEIRSDTGWLHVGYQVKDIGGRVVFAPPKRGKVRDVPLPERVADIFAAHLEAFPPEEVTLPWLTPDGPLVTKQLLFSREQGGPVRRSDFNTYAWKPALVSAGVIPPPEKWARFQASREDGMHALRHFYASVLLDAGESVKALSGYLGHTDPGFTLRVYTHLMPSSDGRTRRAVDALYDALGWAAASRSHGPETAQE
ncbi:tyrosine-type recombinase/integrase [Kitasatospora indigofera]|uniref:tyrosine-type recombinase/integrase n=1 Tax=Kitasatospora indigofera TaxID=67307 RepID=UPI0036A1BB5E